MILAAPRYDGSIAGFLFVMLFFDNAKLRFQRLLKQAGEINFTVNSHII